MLDNITIHRYTDLFKCFEDFWNSWCGESMDNSYWKYICTDKLIGIGGDFTDDIKHGIELWIKANECSYWVWSDSHKHQLNVWCNKEYSRIQLVKAIKLELKKLCVSPKFKNKSEGTKRSLREKFYNELALDCAIHATSDFYERGDV